MKSRVSEMCIFKTQMGRHTLMKHVTLQGEPKSERKIDGNERCFMRFKDTNGALLHLCLKMHETPFNSIDFLLHFRHSLKRYMFH